MERDAFDRVFFVGRMADHTDKRFPVFVQVRLSTNDGSNGPWRLSFTGVEGPKRNGNCKGGCGQVIMSWREGFAPTPDGDFTPEQFARLCDLWDRWHLNDMNAGSPRQMEWLRANPVTWKYPETYFDKAKAALAEAGLQPDTEFDHPRGIGRPYSYGSAWIYEEIPDEVITEILSWPETTRDYPWA